MITATIVRPPFVPFNEQEPVRIYRRNLPHWRQDGTTYFVTFRLADSIPEHVRLGWEDEKRTWLAAHGIIYDGERGCWRKEFERLPSQEQSRFQQHFNRAVQSCLDRGLRSCALADSRCVTEVRSNLLTADGDTFHLGDFVIMPNHVHLLIVPSPGQELAMILKRIKGASAVACNRKLGRTGQFWQPDSYDHIVRSLEQLAKYREYIAGNPLQAGIQLASSAYYKAEWMNRWLDSANGMNSVLHTEL